VLIIGNNDDFCVPVLLRELRNPILDQRNDVAGPCDHLRSWKKLRKLLRRKIFARNASSELVDEGCVCSGPNPLHTEAFLVNCEIEDKEMDVVHFSASKKFILYWSAVLIFSIRSSSSAAIHFSLSRANQSGVAGSRK
jgi:hypothetical protein